MTIRGILKFRITCDGYKPNGQPCLCDLTVESTSQSEAEDKAREFGWYDDHRGWLCNAGGGHIPEFCPGFNNSKDPRCHGICTLDSYTGRIIDPDCFR